MPQHYPILDSDDDNSVRVLGSTSFSGTFGRVCVCVRALCCQCFSFIQSLINSFQIARTCQQSVLLSGPLSRASCFVTSTPATGIVTVLWSRLAKWGSHCSMAHRLVSYSDLKIFFFTAASQTDLQWIYRSTSYCSILVTSSWHCSVRTCVNKMILKFHMPSSRIDQYLDFFFFF